MCHQNVYVSTECSRAKPHSTPQTQRPIRCRKYCEKALAAHRKEHGFCKSTISKDGRKIEIHPDDVSVFYADFGETHSCTNKRDKDGNIIIERRILMHKGDCKQCADAGNSPKLPMMRDYDSVAEAMSPGIIAPPPTPNFSSLISNTRRPLPQTPIFPPLPPRANHPPFKSWYEEGPVRYSRETGLKQWFDDADRYYGKLDGPSQRHGANEGSWDSRPHGMTPRSPLRHEIQPMDSISEVAANVGSSHQETARPRKEKRYDWDTDSYISSANSASTYRPREMGGGGRRLEGGRTYKPHGPDQPSFSAFEPVVVSAREAKNARSPGAVGSPRRLETPRTGQDTVVSRFLDMHLEADRRRGDERTRKDRNKRRDY